MSHFAFISRLRAFDRPLTSRLSVRTAGRLAHFASVTSPLTLLASTAELQKAQELVSSHESQFPKDRRTGTYFVTRPEAEKYWKAKQLVESSVHPDT